MGRDNKPWWRKGKRAWYVKIEGKQKRLHADKGEALRIWHSMLGTHEPPGEGTQSALPVRTVASVVAEYLAHIERTQKPASLVCKHKTLDLLVADKGAMEAMKLDATQAVAWIFTHKKWGPSRRWLAGIIVSACWRWAGMPLARLGLPSPRSRGKDAVMSEEAHRKLLASAPQCYKQALRFLHATGCRPGEMCRLEFRHVIAEVAVIPDHKTDKTGRPRFIVLSGDGMAVINEQAAAYPSGPLFRDTKGRPLTVERLNHWMRKKRLALGIEGAIPYGYRHAYATDALARGVPDALVASLLGHGVQTLHKHYSHLTARMGALRDAAEKTRPSDKEQAMADTPPAIKHDETRHGSVPPGGDDLDRFRALMEGAAWKFARTMPHNPHHYTLRATWASDEEFIRAVLFIREYGYAEKFKGRNYTVIVVGGYKYWTMGDPIRESRTDGKNNTILINRKVYDPDQP